MIINEIQENQDFLKNLYKKGFINHKLIVHTEMYLSYDKYVKLGNDKTSAIQWTADDFKVSTSTIYRVIKSMEQ